MDFKTKVFEQDRAVVLANSKGWVRVRNLGADSGAAVFAVNREGSVLLVREKRNIDGVWLDVWNIPRGAGEANEAGEMVAKREFKEETGIDVPLSYFTYLGKIQPDNGFLMSSVRIYAVDLSDTNAPIQVENNDEVSAAKWWTVAEIEAAVVSHELEDAFTLAGLTLWRAYQSLAKK